VWPPPRQQSDHPLRPTAPQRRLTATLGPDRTQLPRSGPVFMIQGQATHHRHPEHCGRTPPFPDRGLTYSTVTHSVVIAGAGDHPKVMPALGQPWHADGWSLTAPMRDLLSWSIPDRSRRGTSPQHRSKRWSGRDLNLDALAVVEVPLTGHTLPDCLGTTALADPSGVVPREE
jgi:hypothetical protein